MLFSSAGICHAEIILKAAFFVLRPLTSASLALALFSVVLQFIFRFRIFKEVHRKHCKIFKMKIEIINKELSLIVAGFSGIAANGNYAGTAFSLMDRVWPVIKSKGIKHKGLNIWIYEPGEKVFAGVELEDPSNSDPGLETKLVVLTRYAYYKHIGPYSLLKKTGDDMRAELRSMGLNPGLPYVEIYGHWTNDESKLETELLMALEQ